MLAHLVLDLTAFRKDAPPFRHCREVGAIVTVLLDGNLQNWKKLICAPKTELSRREARGPAIGSNALFYASEPLFATHVSLAWRQDEFHPRPRGNALLELLGKCDNNAFRAANVTEPVHVLVLRDFADEFCAMGAQAREYVLDVVDGEHDAM